MKVVAWLIAIAVVLVLIPLVTWWLTATFERKARRLKAEYPRAWVRPMVLGQWMFVLVIDPDQIRLLGLFGRTVQRYARRELVSAEVGKARFPLATRRCLTLRFTNGMRMQLLTIRRWGFASSEADAESAVAYLDERSEK